MPPRPLTRLRKLCLALPEAREVEAWGEPTFRVKTIFAMYAGASNHHGAGRESVWVRANKTNQMLMIAAAPDRFFVPPYVGPYGWIGVYLDSAKTDWDELADLLRDAWRMSVPKKLLTAHESPAAGAKVTTRKAAKSKAAKSKAAKSKAAKSKAATAKAATAKAATAKGATRKGATRKGATPKATASKAAAPKSRRRPTR